MEVQDAINEIKHDLIEVQDEGNEVVHIQSLINFLESFEKSASMSIEMRKLQHASDLEWYKAKNQVEIEEYKAKITYGLEMVKSVKEAGHTALKTSFLMNAGAAVALLAFIGNIWNKTQAAIVIKALANSLGLFSLGVLFVAIATGTTYLTNNFYAVKWNKTGAIVNIISILCVIMSYLTFIFGIIYMYKAFITHFL
jgi:hypothetical protein